MRYFAYVSIKVSIRNINIKFALLCQLHGLSLLCGIWFVPEGMVKTSTSFDSLV